MAVLLVEYPGYASAAGSPTLASIERAMLSAFDEIDAQERVRVLLLTGSGERTFCSGASLDQMGNGAYFTVAWY